MKSLLNKLENNIAIALPNSMESVVVKMSTSLAIMMGMNFDGKPQKLTFGFRETNSFPDWKKVFAILRCYSIQ